MLLLHRGGIVPILQPPPASLNPQLSLRRSLLLLRLTPRRPLLVSATTSTDHLLHEPTAALADDEEEEIQVKQLEDLPEQWRRSKIAWLCKELPSYTHSTFARLLNAQRKWITQDDSTYIVVHFLRTRQNEAALRVYRWMSRQQWFQFSFPLATKLADCLGKDRRVAKCREVFDDVVARGRVPAESTFHILIVAYLSAPVEGALEEACVVYNKMIQFGGYRPLLSLHNSLFRAIVSRTGVSARPFLDQAERIFHNLETSGLEIQKDIYAGLIWLHSYQDVVNRERIEALREGLRLAGFEESRDVLLSVIRACSKEGDVEEGERIWDKIAALGHSIPSQAYVYKMEIYAKIGQPMRALDLFRSMQVAGGAPNVVSYYKIIEVMSRAKEVEIAESLLDEFTSTGLKPLSPSYLSLMDMYLKLGMHDKLELAFSKCNTSRNAYSLYLSSLVIRNEIEKAEEIFDEMQTNVSIGISQRSCNLILGAFLAHGNHAKAVKVWEMMLQKKFTVEQAYTDEVKGILRMRKRPVKKPVTLKLGIEHREILIGLLLGGLAMEFDEQRRCHYIQFEFKQNSSVHPVLRDHIHEIFHEWLCPDTKSDGEGNILDWKFATIPHLHFEFFANQFRHKGRLVIPLLIHRWLSERVLAYWYMYGGLRTASGDILLKLKVRRQEDVERVVKCFFAKSLNCKTKRKGNVCWIGLRRLDAIHFWEMIEPYVLETTKEALDPDGDIDGSGTEFMFGGSDPESSSDVTDEVPE